MTNPVRECQCADCLGAAGHPNKQLQRQMNWLVSRLDEQQRRCILLANRLGLEVTVCHYPADASK
ncbi:MAG: hypothetical protein ACYDBJ_23880 [Aggregatilineales bacterium]